ncbi:MAG: membrane-bound lytic murein transglycosylase MltF, partial [Pseudomonadales bacterium]
MAILYNTCMIASLFRLLSLLVICGWLLACEQKSVLEHIKSRGVISFVTLNGPTTYYSARNGPTGFEFALANEFADYLGVKLVMDAVYGRDDIYSRLLSERADIAAAGLTISEQRLGQFRYCPPYMETQAYVIYKTGSKRPRRVADLLNKKIAVHGDSQHAEQLQQLNKQQQESQQDLLRWKEVYDLETIDLLHQVHTGAIDYTILDRHEFASHRGTFPDLEKALAIGETQHLGWAVARQRRQSADLYQAVDEFFINIQSNGKLEELKERFFGHANNVNHNGTLTFTYNIERRLTKYEKLIKKIAAEYDMEWELLAATAYQESLWNPKAISPTGVRGMMMLTRKTAKQYGVKNRSDVTQSLRGGAQYLLHLQGRIAASITEPDRSWFALASYNVGLGHVNDARKITEQHGGNPDKWMDVKKYLPLLRKKQWYSKT